MRYQDGTNLIWVLNNLEGKRATSHRFGLISELRMNIDSSKKSKGRFFAGFDTAAIIIGR